MIAPRNVLKRFRRYGRVLVAPRRAGDIVSSDAAIRRYEALAARLNARELAERRRLLDLLGPGLDAIDPEAGCHRFTLPADDPVFDAARSVCLAELDNAGAWGTVKGRSGFITRRTLDPAAPAQAPVFDLARDLRLLTPAAGYLGGVPIFEKAVVWYAPREREMEGGSQLLHRDGNARRQIKLFVFLDEVTPESGPLHVLRADASAALYDRLCRAPGGGRIRRDRGAKIPDEMYEGLLPDGALQPATGPAGTCLFADTSRCYHYGSRPGTDARKMLMLKYVTPTARNLPLWGRRTGAPPAHLLRDAGALEPAIRALFAYHAAEPSTGHG